MSQQFVAKEIEISIIYLKFLCYKKKKYIFTFKFICKSLIKN